MGGLGNFSADSDENQKWSQLVTAMMSLATATHASTGRANSKTTLHMTLPDLKPGAMSGSSQTRVVDTGDILLWIRKVEALMVNCGFTKQKVYASLVASGKSFQESVKSLVLDCNSWEAIKDKLEGQCCDLTTAAQTQMAAIVSISTLEPNASAQVVKDRLCLIQEQVGRFKAVYPKTSLRRVKATQILKTLGTQYHQTLVTNLVPAITTCSAYVGLCRAM